MKKILMFACVLNLVACSPSFKVGGSATYKKRKDCPLIILAVDNSKSEATVAWRNGPKGNKDSANFKEMEECTPTESDLHPKKEEDRWEKL